MLLATAAQIREADRIQIEERGMPGYVLMERAGRLAAERIAVLYAGRPFLVLAGPGNNGGDGLVAARYLHLSHEKVTVLLAAPPERYQGDAAIAWNLFVQLGIPYSVYAVGDEKSALADEPVVIDALLGTGTRLPLRGQMQDMISAFAAKGPLAVAIDLPSGLDSDTGHVTASVIPAAHTFSFQLPKVCHAVMPAAELCGEVHVLDIGIWPEVIAQLGIKRHWADLEWAQRQYRQRRANTHKGTYGHVLLIGGSAAMGGAIALAALGAVHAGAGLVTVHAPAPCRLAVNALCPEAMCVTVAEDCFGPNAIPVCLELLSGKDVVAIGPGLGQAPETLAWFQRLLPFLKAPLVLDADALNMLASAPDLWTQLPQPCILTPHPGEMGRLAGGDIRTRRIEAAESFAQQHSCILALKGAGAVTALPDGSTFVNRSGNAGMATGGAGDVLTGCITALIGMGYPVEVAAPLGVWLHGHAGDLLAKSESMEGITASRLAQMIGRAWLDLQVV